VEIPTLRTAAIPASELGRLGDLVRRTAVLRLALALGLLAALALAFAAARSEGVRQAPLVPAGTTGMLVLDLSASVYEGALDVTVARMTETDERTGLIVFSDAAYELLPPGSPSRELAPLLRYFKARPDATLPPNPWEDFRGGTRISTGLTAAREALHRERVRKGSLVLVSDLEILPDDVPHVSEVIGKIRADGFDVRIVPLDPSEEKRALVEQLVGKEAFLRAPVTAGVQAPEERSLAVALPWLFVLAAAALVALLAVNERLLARLEVRP
jgi:hypothetical protein